MKKGQIILGAIALVVTAASTVAFKVAKWNGHPQVYVIKGTACHLCLSLRTNFGTSGTATSCTTHVGTSKVPAAHNETFYTKVVSGTCTTPVVAVTTSL
jgi:hypothetical protein